MTKLFDAAIVGAGPAGSAAAIVLARAGRRVLLLEKDRFPRPKVCGEFLSSDALPSLERLGAREAVERLSPERIGRGRVHLPGGREVSFALPAPALGISRFLLDDLLARRARDSGAEVRFGTRVLSVEPRASGFRVVFVEEGREEKMESRVAIGAWGRWDALDKTMGRGFLRKRDRFFGWSRDYASETPLLAGEVRLYLFPGGYCGLSRVEGGRINLAGVISERRHRLLRPGWEAVLDHARRSNSALDGELGRLRPGPTGLLGTGPVFFAAKPPTERGVLMTGDAAGVLDPFSGEGQAAALASGMLAGETAEEALSGRIPLEGLPAAYAKAWRRRFARRFQWSTLLRPLILRPALSSIAGRLAGERLVRFGIAATRR